jgi:hypothetical protein
VAVATWNPTLFFARYPEFPMSKSAQLGAIFASDAGLYLNNTDCSIVQDITVRTNLLNMLTAHIAFLGGALSADGQTRPVGQVLSAAEGSVNASFANITPAGGSAAWFNQSQYGAAFWQATSSLRGMRFVPGPPPVLNGIYNPMRLWRR